jgi:hypothetical protein
LIAQSGKLLLNALHKVKTTKPVFSWFKKLQGYPIINAGISNEKSFI